MSEVTMDEISIQIEGNSDKAIESLERLTGVLDKLTKSTGFSMTALQQTNKKIQGIANSANKSGNKTNETFNNMGKSVLGFVTKLTGVKLGFLDTTNRAAEFISTYAGFNKVLGTSQKNLDDARQFVEDLTDAWYLDEQQVMNSMSRYYNMTSTMGFTEDAALRMSKNLTQLSYNLQALGTTGATITEVQNQLSSALRGEAEGLAKFGISLNQATLQTVLYENGINRTVSSLTAAQKAEVIYYQIMKQTYSKHGYYAEQLSKKILQPAMALQIFQNQMKNLARAIGSIFIPIITTLMPYLIALTQLLTNLAKRIADFFGFELAAWDDGATEDISAGFSDIADSADAAGKKIKGMLGDFDELHTISFDNGGGAGAGAGAGGSLGLDPSEFEYGAEWLGVTNEQLERAKGIIATIKDYIIAIGIGLAGFTITKNVLDFFNKIFDLGLTSGEILLKGLGVGLILGGVYLTYKGIKKILNGELTSENILEVLIGNATIIGGTMMLTGRNLKLGIGVALAIDSLFTEFEGMKKLINGEFSWESVFQIIGGAFGVGLAALVAGASLPITGGVIILSLAATFAFSTFPSLQEIKESLATLRDGILNWWNSTSNIDKFKTLGTLIFMGLIVGLGVAIAGIPGAIAGLFVAVVTAIVTFFDIHSPSRVMEKYGVNIIMGIFVGITSMFGKVTEIFSQLRNDITQKFQEIKINVTNKVQEIKTNALNKFEEIKNGIKSKIEGAKEIVRKAIEAIKGFFKFEWSLPKIKLPHFGIEWDTQGAIAEAFKKIGLQGLPKLKVDFYEEGGFPNAGDLFVANEAGAEWVGSMNGRTAVANQDQISTGVRQAAYEGMKQALAESDFGGVEVYNYLDSKDIASKMTRVKKSNANMYG